MSDLREIAKRGKLVDANGNKIHQFHASLRPPKPEAEAIAQKSEAASIMEMMVKVLAETQQSAIDNSKMQSEAIIEAVKNNEKKESPLEQWEFTHVRQDGKIISTIAKQIR